MKEFINKSYNRWLKLNDKIKFVLVGGYNSGFSYLLFCLLQISFADHLHYLAILTISHFLSVFNSFICFRIFVFHSKGSFWKEYLKVNLVYVGYLICNAVLLYILKDLIKINLFVSQLICIILLAFLVYLSHKYFSFKKFI